jgi:2-oxoacid:acceptor oxidoreductase delta subunit (pyruvate/2-ketoisovalerate family)
MNKRAKIELRSFKDFPPSAFSLGDMRWNLTGSWRYIRPRYVRRVPACNFACPGGNDVQGWLRLLEKGDIKSAYSLQIQENPFPRITGRVCFRACEDKCNRRFFDQSVAINSLERFIADSARKAGFIPPQRPVLKRTNKKVSVIGAGPAGLSAAYYLAYLGHSVTIFEALPKAGGILRVGIPHYRLPPHIIDEEIEKLLELDVEFKFNTRVGVHITFEEILEKSEAVFVATGAHKSRSLGVEGEKHPAVLSGLEFLRRVSQGEELKIGDEVIVVGGGNTAIDAARSALRLGKKVTIVYRRSRVEMPAFEEEIQEAEHEKIKLDLLALPLRVIIKNGELYGLECIRARLGEPDQSGRRRPEPIPGTEFIHRANTIIAAIGEICEFDFLPKEINTKWGAVVVDPYKRTSLKQVFAGGDLIDQPRTVIDAIASGKQAAIAIDCYLRKINIKEKFSEILRLNKPSMGNYLNKKLSSDVPELDTVVEFEDINLAYFSSLPASKIPCLDLKARLWDKGADIIKRDPKAARFPEVKIGFSEELARKEIARCFNCGRCSECDVCFIFCPDVAIKKQARGYSIDYDYCKGCGICVEECPRASMEMIRE